MKHRTVLSAALSALALLCAAAVQTHAATVTLFHETFDGNLQNWTYTSSAARDYDNTWTEGDSVKPGYKGVKLGSTSVTGSITSESFSLSNTTEPVSITIIAAAYSNNGGGKEGIAVKVYDSSDAVVFSDTVVELTQHTSTAMDEIPTTAAYTKVFTVPASSLPSSGGIHLKIESTYTKTGQRRALIGDVLVTQTVSSGVNTPPAATQPSVDVAATVGTAAEVDLADYFTDADGDPLTYALDTGVGAVSGSIWSFTPNAAGSFSAEVSATDPSGDSAVMTINVTVSDAVPPPLSPPTIEPVSPEDVTADGFVLRWLAVENALGYDLVVTNVAEQMEAGCQVSYAGPFPPDVPIVTATVTGLDPDTLYAVAVRALADANYTPSTGYSDSDWSTPVEITTTLEGGLLRATLFNETFDRAGGNSWNRGSTAFDASLTDESGWIVGTIRRGPEGLLLGTASNPGSATTREIVVSNEIENATVVISFLAASYINETTTGTLTASNTVTGAETVLLNLTPDSMSNSATEPLAEGTSYEFEATVPARFALRFESLASASDKRLLLDSIKVTQVYDPNYAALSAPTGVEESDVGKYGFTVSWTGVEHAEGYEVWLDGAVAGSCASTDTAMELTGLSDGTTYSVQVKALGDNLHVGDSLLSTAISVTTLADAQKIDFTVTGAPTGDVFAGDAVAFTVTAETESTHAAAEVSFSGIAGATFAAATGAFSWTPTEGDVGSHTATFASGDYSTNVTITVVSALKTETLAAEYFSEIKSTSWTSTSGYISELEGDMGRWMGHDIIKTKAAVIIGRAGSSGNAVSPAVELKVQTPGSLSISFDTGSLSNKTASVKASILDAADNRVVFEQTFASLASLPVDATAVSDAGAHFTLEPGSSVALPAEVKVKFETIESAGDNSQRAYVDTVVFAQTVSARIRDLAAPTGLVEVPESVTTNGFSVAWSAVSGATNYVVRVTDASGAVVFSAPFCAATSATVTGLADDEAYNVQVRATGDEAVWFASPWSTAVNIRTERSALHPTLTLGPWTNVAGKTDPVATLANTAPVAAALDGGEGAVVEYVSIFPEPDSAPTFADGTLSWTPAETDAEKPFTLTFTMAAGEEGAPVYTTNVVVSVGRLPETVAPVVTFANVAWNSFELRWEDQYRASDFRVRVWTGTSDPDATGTEFGEHFEEFPSVKPDGWTFENGDEVYNYEKTRLAFKSDGTVTSPELSGSVTNLSFEIRPSSGSDSGSVLTVEGWNGTAWITIASYTGETLKTEKKTIAGLAGAYSRFRWGYTQHGTKNCGLGSIVFSGTGLPTARFLPGWGLPGKRIGKVTTVTVAKPFPGRFTGRVQNPQTGKWEDTGTACVNYAEVTVVGTDGKTVSTVVAVPVPYLPGSVRATLLIFR